MFFFCHHKFNILKLSLYLSSKNLLFLLLSLPQPMDSWCILPIALKRNSLDISDFSLSLCTTLFIKSHELCFLFFQSLLSLLQYYFCLVFGLLATRHVALEKEMETHSSVLAWRIPGMGEPGGLPFVGSHRVGHDWSNLAAAAAAATWLVTH